MNLLRTSLLVLPFAALTACTINPRPVVVTTPPPVVTAPAPVVMGAQPTVTVDVPPGYMPAPGSCRIWMPGLAPAQQSLPAPCSDLQNRTLPTGAVLLRG